MSAVFYLKLKFRRRFAPPASLFPEGYDYPTHTDAVGLAPGVAVVPEVPVVRAGVAPNVAVDEIFDYDGLNLGLDFDFATRHGGVALPGIDVVAEGPVAAVGPAYVEERGPAVAVAHGPAYVEEAPVVVEHRSSVVEHRPAVAKTVHETFVTEHRPAVVAERRPVVVAEQRPVVVAERRPVVVAERRPIAVAARGPAVVAARRPAVVAAAPAYAKGVAVARHSPAAPGPVVHTPRRRASLWRKLHYLEYLRWTYAK